MSDLANSPHLFYITSDLEPKWWRNRATPTLTIFIAPSGQFKEASLLLGQIKLLKTFSMSRSVVSVGAHHLLEYQLQANFLLRYYDDDD